MQLLLIHSDYIEYETKKQTPVAEKIEESLKSGRLEEALTAFTAVESVVKPSGRSYKKGCL
jgi:threonyl-tRNA synthetase